MTDTLTPAERLRTIELDANRIETQPIPGDLSGVARMVGQLAQIIRWMPGNVVPEIKHDATAREMSMLREVIAAMDKMGAQEIPSPDADIGALSLCVRALATAMLERAYPLVTVQAPTIDPAKEREALRATAHTRSVSDHVERMAQTYEDTVRDRDAMMWRATGSGSATVGGNGGGGNVNSSPGAAAWPPHAEPEKASDAVPREKIGLLDLVGRNKRDISELGEEAQGHARRAMAVGAWQMRYNSTGAIIVVMTLEHAESLRDEMAADRHGNVSLITIGARAVAKRGEYRRKQSEDQMMDIGPLEGGTWHDDILDVLDAIVDGPKS